MHDICSYLDSQIISCVCAMYVSSYSEVKSVYDVYQYIFSGEESMCWTCIIYSLRAPPHSELSPEECHPA
jgi:hypothetical protein